MQFEHVQSFTFSGYSSIILPSLQTKALKTVHASVLKRGGKLRQSIQINMAAKSKVTYPANKALLTESLATLALRKARRYT
ncbi:MAG: hypothetical protein GY820_02520 [Gammaproteobacteria bacterium]|nr:hypothetical protein [Gammaproteobacteria bacterium]